MTLKIEGDLPEPRDPSTLKEYRFFVDFDLSDTLIIRAASDDEAESIIEKMATEDMLEALNLPTNLGLQIANWEMYYEDEDEPN